MAQVRKNAGGDTLGPHPPPKISPHDKKKILFSTWQKKTYSFFLSPSTSNASSPTFVNFCNFFVNFSVNFFLHLHRYNDSGSVFIFPKCCYSLWWLLQLKNSFFLCLRKERFSTPEASSLHSNGAQNKNKNALLCLRTTFKNREGDRVRMVGNYNKSLILLLALASNLRLTHNKELLPARSYS